MKLMPGPRTRRRLFTALVIILIAEFAFSTYIYRVMRRPPEAFASVMAKLPQPYVFMLVPFEALWMHARSGTLQVGDRAPDFTLTKLDHSGTIQLSALNLQQPVVLVFGSYT